MKEITILSGKGGAGKTSIAAALASLAPNAVFCDNDVDAADLHLILKPEIKETYPFDSGSLAFIDQETCTNCGVCQEACRFEAIFENSDGFPGGLQPPPEHLPVEVMHAHNHKSCQQE